MRLNRNLKDSASLFSKADAAGNYVAFLSDDASWMRKGFMVLQGSEVSFFNLFWNAHFVVKLVIIALVGASVWSWAIIFEKTILFRKTRLSMIDFEDAFWSGRSFEELYAFYSGARRGMARLFVVAMEEWQRLAGFGGLHERIGKVQDLAIQNEISALEQRLFILATIASASPFVGLFGTVWGIMNSFRSIAASQNVSLAVVAPGIAEALFATAFGLIAAIPAVVAYNKFQKDVAFFQMRLESFADEFSMVFLRQMNSAEESP